MLLSSFADIDYCSLGETTCPHHSQCTRVAKGDYRCVCEAPLVMSNSHRCEKTVSTKPSPNEENVNKQKTNSGTISLDSNKQKTNSGTISLDSNKQKTNSGTISLDSNKQKTNSGTISLDSNKQKTNNGTISLDSNKNKINTDKDSIASDKQKT